MCICSCIRHYNSNIASDNCYLDDLVIYTALKFSFHVVTSLYIRRSSDEPFWSPVLNRDQFFRRLSLSVRSYIYCGQATLVIVRKNIKTTYKGNTFSSHIEVFVRAPQNPGAL